jgi:hypothetical protein
VRSDVFLAKRAFSQALGRLLVSHMSIKIRNLSLLAKVAKLANAI